MRIIVLRIAYLISGTIGFIIFGASGLLYVTQLLRESSEKVSVVGLSAFAIIGALSGLCFTLVSLLEQPEKKSRCTLGRNIYILVY